MLKSENLQTGRKWEGNLMLPLKPWPPGRGMTNQGKKEVSGKALNNVGVKSLFLNPRNVVVVLLKKFFNCM